ncbi:hypothetical protein T484DRAFT_1768968, partial [Baffinella frigidus]
DALPGGGSGGALGRILGGPNQDRSSPFEARPRSSPGSRPGTGDALGRSGGRPGSSEGKVVALLPGLSDTARVVALLPGLSDTARVAARRIHHETTSHQEHRPMSVLAPQPGAYSQGAFGSTGSGAAWGEYAFIPPCVAAQQSTLSPTDPSAQSCGGPFLYRGGPVPSRSGAGNSDPSRSARSVGAAVGRLKAAAALRNDAVLQLSAPTPPLTPRPSSSPSSPGGRAPPPSGLMVKSPPRWPVKPGTSPSTMLMVKGAVDHQNPPLRSPVAPLPRSPRTPRTPCTPPGGTRPLKPPAASFPGATQAGSPRGTPAHSPAGISGLAGNSARCPGEARSSPEVGVSRAKREALRFFDEREAEAAAVSPLGLAPFRMWVVQKEEGLVR